jgi:hypothetical protein
VETCGIFVRSFFVFLALVTCVVSAEFVFGSSSIYKKRRASSRVPEKIKLLHLDD